MTTTTHDPAVWFMLVIAIAQVVRTALAVEQLRMSGRTGRAVKDATREMREAFAKADGGGSHVAAAALATSPDDVNVVPCTCGSWHVMNWGGMVLEVEGVRDFATKDRADAARAILLRARNVS